MTEPKTEEATPKEATPTALEAKVAEYEVGPSDFDPELDSHPDPEPKPAAKPTSPDRNPDGTFKSPSHSGATSRMAADLGMTQADIDAYSPAALDDAVYRLNKQKLEMVEKLGRSAPKETPSEPAPAQVSPLKSMGIDEEGIHEDIVKALNSALARLAALERMEGGRQARAVQTHGEMIDGGLADADAEFFGKGRIHEIDKDSPYFQRRIAVFNVLKERTFDPANLRAEAAKVARQLFGLTAKEAAKEGERIAADKSPLAAKQKDWAEGAVARPTHRNGAEEPKGPRRAAKAVAALMRERGMLSGDEEEGLP